MNIDTPPTDAVMVPVDTTSGISIAQIITDNGDGTATTESWIVPGPLPAAVVRSMLITLLGPVAQTAVMARETGQNILRDYGDQIVKIPGAVPPA